MLSSLGFLSCLSLIIPRASFVSAKKPLPVSIEHRSDIQLTLPTTLTIDMPIDHFDDSNTQTYQNRYWINDTFHSERGPIFFYNHSEGIFSEGIFSEGFVQAFLGETGTLMAPMQLAEQFNGVAVLWDHHFYGDNLPFPLGNDI